MCDECNNIFTTPGELDSHIKVAHKAQSCKFCAKTCQSQPDLNYHLHKSHREDILAQHLSEYLQCDPHHPQELAHVLHCNLCAETFSDMMLLNAHIKQHHVAQERTSDNCTCYICDKAYGSFGVLYSHIQQHHNTTALAPNETVARICHLCDHTLLGIEDMKNHLANHHYAYSFYSCNMCNTTSSSLQTFKEHLNSEHDIADTAPCLTCNNVFLNEEELQSHIKTIHVLDIASPCRL